MVSILKTNISKTEIIFRFLNLEELFLYTAVIYGLSTFHIHFNIQYIVCIIIA